MTFLISWLTLAFGFWLAGRIIDGFVIGDFKQAAVVSLVFAIIHFFVGWFLMGVLAVGTLGLPLLLGLGFVLRWIVSAVVLKITDALMDRLTVRGWAPAFWAAGLFSILSAVKDAILR